MYENFDGSSPNQTKGAQNVASRFSVEPEDCVSFGDHNECLKNTEIICINAHLYIVQKYFLHFTKYLVMTILK